jgi:hypothetical protein
MQNLRLFLSLVSACALPSAPAAQAPPRILFVGNSLTYVNDLPAMVKAVAAQAGTAVPETEMVAFPDFALEDHWAEGTARRRLTQARWDFVVLQQGPSSLPENRANLAEWSERFAPLIREAGARPILYMVWPSRQRARDFPGVRAAYLGAAARVGGLFAPAGEAWRLALEEDPAAPLYDGDGFHPAPAGTYLAAMVVLARISPLDPLSLPPTIPGARHNPHATVRVLQRSAATALTGEPTQP